MSDRYYWEGDLRTPHTELEHVNQDRLMRLLVKLTVGVALLLAIPYAVVAITDGAWQAGLMLGVIALMLVDLIVVRRLLNRARIDAAAWWLFPALMIMFAVNGLMAGSVHTIAPVLISLIVVAGIVMGTAGNFVTAGIGFALWVAAIILNQPEVIPPAPLPELVSTVIGYALPGLSFIFVAVLGYDASRRLKQTLSDANYQLVESNMRLEEANRLKTQFTARTSHELRTPLNAIVVSADLLNRKLYGPLTGDQVDALDRILRNSRRLQRLIDDILDLSKIEAGKLELSESAFPLNNLCEMLRTNLEPKAQAKGLSFNVSIAPDLPLNVVADEHRLSQVISNLADNAIKFTDSGSVRIDIERAGDSRWRVLVKDSGRGIHEKDFDTIFEEFRRSDSAGAIAGTGLGLPITKQLVQLMKGTIHLRSQLGQGSTFEVVLPLKLPEPELVSVADHQVMQPDPSTPK